MRPIAFLFDTSTEDNEMLTQWRAWQQSQGLSERTITERYSTMRHLTTFTETTLTEITAEHIITYCARPNLSQSSRASYHATIRAFYTWALRTGQVNDDPTELTPRPKRPKTQPRPLHAAHIGALLITVNRRRTRAMIILAAYAGLRVHEVAKFRGEDLDRISGVLTVTGKGGKTAMIPAHELVLEVARDFPPWGDWFPAHDGAGPVTPHAVSKAIRGTMRRAGFDGKPHQLRHYYATELLDAGVDIRVVKELMRHESIATTEIYTRVSMKRMFEGIERLPRAA